MSSMKARTLRRIGIDSFFLKHEAVKLPHGALIVLLHGMAYGIGWKPNVCAKETGMAVGTVYRSLKWLINNGYAIVYSNYVMTRKRVFRFTDKPFEFEDTKLKVYRGGYVNMGNSGNAEGGEDDEQDVSGMDDSDELVDEEN